MYARVRLTCNAEDGPVGGIELQDAERLVFRPLLEAQAAVVVESVVVVVVRGGGDAVAAVRSAAVLVRHAANHRARLSITLRKYSTSP